MATAGGEDKGDCSVATRGRDGGEPKSRYPFQITLQNRVAICECQILLLCEPNIMTSSYFQSKCVQVAAQTMAQGENSSRSSNGGVPKVGAINQRLHCQAKEHMVVDKGIKLHKSATLRKAIDHIRHLHEKNRWPKS
jgi:hypothetical protein